MENSIFIDVLTYGAKRGAAGVSFEELKKRINDNRDTELTETELALLNNIFKECFASGGSGTEKQNLKTEYYFRLIEYQALKESWKAGKSANRNAFTAIGLAVFAIVLTTFLAFTQWNRPITLSKSDLNALTSSNRHANVQREVKLDSLQMAQILAAVQYRGPEPKNQKPKEQGQEISHHELINQYFENE
jgi:hypothetical protein